MGRKSALCIGCLVITSAILTAVMLPLTWATLYIKFSSTINSVTENRVANVSMTLSKISLTSSGWYNSSTVPVNATVPTKTKTFTYAEWDAVMGKNETIWDDVPEATTSPYKCTAAKSAAYGITVFSILVHLATFLVVVHIVTCTQSLPSKKERRLAMILIGLCLFFNGLAVGLFVRNTSCNFMVVNRVKEALTARNGTNRNASGSILAGSNCFALVGISGFFLLVALLLLRFAVGTKPETSPGVQSPPSQGQVAGQTQLSGPTAV